MTTTSNAHADREDEAAIRKQIAEEVREELSKKEDAGLFNLGWRCGMLQALGIIERGTGVATEEAQP